MFTPVQTLLGGLLLHISTTSLLSDTGRIFGISGILDGALLGDHARWRWAVLAGLVGGPAVVAATGLGPAIPDTGSGAWAAMSAGRLALAGLLVGFGSRLGSGCTSGHFLCGVSRLSPRSLIATATFFLTAVVTARLFPAPVAGDLPAYSAYIPPPAHILALAATVLAAVGVKTVLPGIVRRLAGCGAESGASAAKGYGATERNGNGEGTTNGTNGTTNGTNGATKDTEANTTPSTAPRRSWACDLPYLVSGLTFSLGLIVSGMLSPLKVLGFLRFPPPLDQWDPSLGMIVLGGVIPNAIQYASLRRSHSDEPKPKLPWEQWRVPSRADIDWRLLVGSTVFGAGWGLAGVCPGPALITPAQLAVNAVFGANVSAAATGWTAYAASLAFGMAAAHAV